MNELTQMWSHKILSSIKHFERERRREGEKIPKRNYPKKDLFALLSSIVNASGIITANERAEQRRKKQKKVKQNGREGEEERMSTATERT